MINKANGRTKATSDTNYLKILDPSFSLVT